MPQNGDDQSDDDQQNGEDDQQNEDGDNQEGSVGEGSDDQGGSGALGIISGYLVDTQGNPLTGVLVELHSDPMQTYTDDEGFFLFENVEPGEHTIFIIDERLDSAYSTKVEFIKDDSGQPQMQEYKK